MAKLYGQDPNVDFAATNLMSFGKSFSRLNGQPLDKSEVWYNDFEALEAYAKTEAAYAGQKVSYIKIDENGTGTVTHYSIEVDGTLKLLGSSEGIEEINTLLTGENGLVTRVETLETNMPTEEQIQQAISEAVAGASHLKRKIVDKAPSQDETLYDLIDVDEEDALTTIYMIKTGLEDDSNKYNEYIVIAITDSEGKEVRHIEPVGSWEVDLNDYAKKDDLDNYVIKVDGARLLTQADIDQFSKGEENVINSASADFSIDSKQLKLSESFQNNLIAALNNKYDKTAGLLITADDRKKLDALQLNGEDLEVSGTVSTSQITDLEEWLNTNAGQKKGLSENNLTDDLYAKLSSSIAIVSTSAQLDIDTSGVLSIVEVNIDQVKGLEELLNEKASSSSLISLENSVISVANTLNSMQQTVSQNTTDITSLQDQLKWKALKD